MSSRDNRHFERYSVRWRIKFSSPEITCTARTADISQNGASFHSETTIPASTKASISLHLPPSGLHPHGRELSIHAKVVYSILQGKAGFRIGLQFTKIDEKSESILKQALINVQNLVSEIR